MLTHAHYESAAKKLGVEVAVIKAVAEVESSGSGFLSTGEPAILFEPHQYYRELKKRGIVPETLPEFGTDILYKKWGEQPYGKSSTQHAKLARATKINREAALCSCSWGSFQIMGYHYKACGCDTIQDFINKMYESEEAHLELFCNFIINNGYAKYLREKNWEGFAYRYNGAGYAKHNYHKKLKSSFLKHKSFTH